MNDISVTIGLALGGLGLFLLAFAIARQGRKRMIRRASATVETAAAGAGAGSVEPLLRRMELRLDEIEAGIAARIEAQAAAGSPEDRLREVAGSLVGLIRDKNATLETALAGLDQLRARLRALEQMGDLAETRGLYERLEAKIEEMRATQAVAEAALEERISGLRARAEAEAAPQAALAEQFSRLYAQKDEGLAALLARLAPLEARLSEVEIGFEAARGVAGPARAALERFEERLEALRAAQSATQSEIAALRAETGSGPISEIATRLSNLHAQKEALVETLLARIATVEADLAARDPRAALDGFAGRLEALSTRLGLLEAPQDHPFTEISEQLTRLYAQRDSTVEVVFARLAPLEARLLEIEAGLAAQDPRGMLDRFAERLEAAQAAREQAEGGLRDRIAALEAPGENPFAEISDQLTRLYAQKDATVEVVFARLAPLEARLGEIEAGLAAQDPQAALDRFAERLEAAQAAREQAEGGLRDRIAALEAPGENPFAEISDQLTRLYAQKDATVETVFARLAPLEARLGEIEAGLAAQDPRGMLDRFAERLEAAQAAREQAEGGLRDRIAALEAPGENPFAEISDQLTRLYAQKDATVEVVFARLAPLEARLGEIEAGLAAQDPQAALDRFAERLEAAQAAREQAEGGLRDRIAALEAPGENPFAEISDQLTRLYAQKDATVETVFARLAPLEARLGEIEAGLAAQDPRGMLDRFAERLEAAQAAREQAEGGLRDRIAALEAPGENPFAEISDQLTRLYAQKDATVEVVFARLAPLEARLGEIEAGLAAQDPQAALDRFAERLEGLRGRLNVLETPGENPFAEISHQLTALYAQKDATVETIFARLMPLEERLAGIEAGVAGSLPRIEALEAGDPRDMLRDLAERLETLRDGQGEAAKRIETLRETLGEAVAARPFAEIADQLTQMHAQKDAGIEAVTARLAPLEERLAALESATAEGGAAEARAEAQAIAAQMIAARVAAEQTELFANRLALLEATLPRLTADQARVAVMLEQRREAEVREASVSQASVTIFASQSDAEASALEAEAEDLAALLQMPRVVSLHHK